MSGREQRVAVIRVRAGAEQRCDDAIAVEEPLEIRIAARALGVTMRTPGNDEELAAGLLLAEGIVRSSADIGSIVICRDESVAALRNVVNVRLVDGVRVDWERLQRSLLTTSSCGLCGKAQLEALKTRAEPLPRNGLRIEAGALLAMPALLRGRQVVFEMTGGLHAAGLFRADGTLVHMREDVGRHNAVDKALGAALIQNMLPLDRHLLMVSGRASYEIVQKAIVARISIVAAVSAPSSLAVDLAEEFGLTLVGFLRGDGFNLYSHPERIAS